MSTAILKAAEILKQGGLVAFPTETVYGLGADAKNEAAIHKIFAAKNRPYHHPLIVHLPDTNHLQNWARDIPDDVYVLAKQFWPGPLTMILKKQQQVLDIVTGGQDSIGLRIPNHSIAKELLETFGSGIAAPSANRFTHISPTTAAAVLEELQNKVDLILDGGPCEVGVESTIIDLAGKKPTILRPGMIKADEISKVLNKEVITTRDTKQRTPGMHHLHYAPRTKTTLISEQDFESTLKTFSQQSQHIALLLRTKKIDKRDANINVVYMPLDVVNYAHDLYQTLRQLDHGGYAEIFIEEVPRHHDWDAIRDRLYKATSTR